MKSLFAALLAAALLVAAPADAQSQTEPPVRHATPVDAGHARPVADQNEIRAKVAVWHAEGSN